MPGRFIDWVRGLTAKSTTIDGSEQVHIDSAGLSQKALLSDVIRYGGGNTTRVTTIGNANIHQSNTGAMWLEVTGQTGGNARGAGAFDWQAVRGSGDAARVASGNGSFAAGTACTASGSYSFAFGSNCAATGAQSFAAGVSSSAGGNYAFAFGSGSSASGTLSVAFGSSISTNAAQFSIGRFSNGRGQSSLQPMALITTDAATTAMLASNDAGSRFVAPAKTLNAITGVVTAFCEVTGSPNTYFAKAWEIRCVIKRDNNNNTVIVGTPIITELAKDADGTPTPSTWAIASITADDTNEALAINVTGQTGQTIRWQASLFYSQVGF